VETVWALLEVLLRKLAGLARSMESARFFK
jgi:hypothetical protein